MTVMMMKQETPSSASISTTCGNCSVEERRLLHNVRNRGIFRRLCTSCVLKLHPQSFCPTCFAVYDRPPPSNEALTCFKCYSSTHSHCADPKSPRPYICPPCSNPNVPIFSLKKAKEGGCGGGGGADENCLVIDKKASRVLLAAATIAAVSMNKAAVAARAEAERRAKEAASTRKRAREALEHIAFLVAKDKLKRKEMMSTEVSGSGTMGFPDRNYKGISGNGVGTQATGALAVQNRIANQRGVDVVDGASEVLASLNAVDLKGKERLQGSRAQNPVSGPPNNGVPTGMDDNDRSRVNSSNHGTVNQVEGAGEFGQIKNNNAVGEKVKNGPLPVFPGGGHLQHMQRNHGTEDNAGSQMNM